MARSNKYAAINFNEIYGPKRPTSSSSSSSSSPSQNTPLSSARTHGRMLILTRPSKPQTPPPTPPPTRTPPEKPPAPTTAEPDSISLRPLTRTTTTTAAAAAAKDVKESPPPLTPPKPEPFVPPHLRPGFAGREERPQPEVQREKQGFRPRGGDDEGRPRSGGGYEGMRRGGPGSDMERNRPGSGGNRPSPPSGWNGYYRSPPSHFDDRV